MTRAELKSLQSVLADYESGHPFRRIRARVNFEELLAAAEREHAAEDAHHDAAEAGAYPVNVHQQAAE